MTTLAVLLLLADLPGWMSGTWRRESPKADFRKRILDWKDGGRLCARVDDGGNKGEEFGWQRVGENR